MTALRIQKLSLRKFSFSLQPSLALSHSALCLDMISSSETHLLHRKQTRWTNMLNRRCWRIFPLPLCYIYSMDHLLGDCRCQSQYQVKFEASCGLLRTYYFVILFLLCLANSPLSFGNDQLIESVCRSLCTRATLSTVESANFLSFRLLCWFLFLWTSVWSPFWRNTSWSPWEWIAFPVH